MLGGSGANGAYANGSLARPGRAAAGLGFGTRAVVLATVLAAGTLPATAGYAADPGDPTSGAYIVVLRDDASAVGSQARQLIATYGGTLRAEYDQALRGFTVRMPAAAARRLAEDPEVEYVEPDRKISLAGPAGARPTVLAGPAGARPTVLADVQAQPPWGLDRIDQARLPLSLSYAPPAAGAGTTVYVLDTGIRRTSTDLAGRVGTGYSVVEDGLGTDDCHGHGTHVAATIAGATYGVAKAATVVPVRAMDCDGTATYSHVISAIDWIAEQAQRPAVVNMSISGPRSTAVDEAIRRATGRGITFVVAAGNNGDDPPWMSAGPDACSYSPGSTPEAITVGATDSADAVAGFSNRGSCVDLLAPGVGITSAWVKADSGYSDTATATLSGTSMATPHVAGAAAMVLSIHPGYTPAQVADVLSQVASHAVVSGLDPGTPNLLLYVGAELASATSAAGTRTQQPAQQAVPQPPAPVAQPLPCNVAGDDTDVPIGDRRAVVSGLRIGNCPGRADRRSRVAVSVQHGRRGDLTIELLAPNGSRYTLKRSSNRDRSANVNAVYLVNLSKRNRNGLWRLRIRDTRKGYSGYLDSWSITI